MTATDKTAVGPAEVTRVGNVVADPELRFSASGKAWAPLRIAVETPVVPGDWSGDRETVFYEVVVFDRLAENVCHSLTKGCRVVVHGKPELREYEAADGSVQTAKRIVAQAVGIELRFTRAATVKAGNSARPARSQRQPEPETGEEDPWASF